MQSSLRPEEDHLDEDKPFKHLVKKQNFCVISMLTPNAFPENKREQYKDQSILGVKVRGVFETYEEAKKRSEDLQKMDPNFNLFVGEIGKWLPFDVDISNMQTEDDPVYREQSLNQYMKAYKDCLKEEEFEEKQRREEALKATNAKVVTGIHDAPECTGIGKFEITPPGITPNPNPNPTVAATAAATSNLVEPTEPTLDEQIDLTKNDKSKIVAELESSKSNLKELESKLSAINQMYADLKK